MRNDAEARTQKLVLEALHRHREVDDGGLYRDLRQVVGVRHFRGHEQFEEIIIIDLRGRQRSSALQSSGRVYPSEVVAEFGPKPGLSRGEERGSRRWRRTTRSDTHPSEDKLTQAAHVAVAEPDQPPSALREDGLR